MGIRRRALRSGFYALCAVAKPVGGIRPRRLYPWLGRHLFGPEDRVWKKDRWENEFWLSPYFHIDCEILMTGAYSSDLIEMMLSRLRRGMTVIDVGANIGAMTVPFAQWVGRDGKVWAFEPDPRQVALLEKNLRRNGYQNVNVVAAALGDGDGPVTLLAPDLDERNQGIGTIVPGAGADKVRREVVPIWRFDSFASRHGIDHADLIKVDIQGAELLFLAGAMTFLQRVKPQLVIEVSPVDLATGGSGSRSLLKQIALIGYDLFTMDRRQLRHLDPDTIPSDFSAAGILCLPRLGQEFEGSDASGRRGK